MGLGTVTTSLWLSLYPLIIAAVTVFLVIVAIVLYERRLYLRMDSPSTTYDEKRRIERRINKVWLGVATACLLSLFGTLTAYTYIFDKWKQSEFVPYIQSTPSVMISTDSILSVRSLNPKAPHYRVSYIDTAKELRTLDVFAIKFDVPAKGLSYLEYKNLRRDIFPFVKKGIYFPTLHVTKDYYRLYIKE